MTLFMYDSYIKINLYNYRYYNYGNQLMTFVVMIIIIVYKDYYLDKQSFFCAANGYDF